MATNKNLIIIALTTFCLTATVFTVVPTRSQNNRYDPWLDTNDDGLVNIVDLAKTATAFGSSGDPTKNVNVTNWPSASYTLINGTLNMSQHELSTSAFYCGGYSRLSLMIWTTSASIGVNNSVIIYLYGLQWVSDSHLPLSYANENPISSNVFNTTISSTSFFSGPGFFITETKGPYCALLFNYIGDNLPANWWVAINYCVYLRNE